MLLMTKKVLLYTLIGAVIMGALVYGYVVMQSPDYEESIEEQLTEGDELEDIEADLNTTSELEGLEGDVDSLESDLSNLESQL